MAYAGATAGARDSTPVRIRTNNRLYVLWDVIVREVIERGFRGISWKFACFRIFASFREVVFYGKLLLILGPFGCPVGHGTVGQIGRD